MKWIVIFLECLRNCMLFRRVTDEPRWTEIFYGVVAWINITIIVYTIIRVSV